MGGRITLGLLAGQLDLGYSRPLIRGVSDWARENEANLIVFAGRTLRSPYEYEYQNNVVYEYVKPGTIDALIMATGTLCNFVSPEELREYIGRFRGMPVVSMGIRLDGITSVLVDNRTGIREAVFHLADGHAFRRIAFLMGPRNNEEAETRFSAYREAIRERGLDDDPTLHLAGDFTAPGGRRAIAEYLKLHGRPGFQALMAANDEMAIAAGQLLAELGYAIPRDVALIGFDNIGISQFVVPPLSTIEQPLYEQGHIAADLASRLLRGEAAERSVLLPTSLVLRSSCGCLPRSVVEFDGFSVGADASGLAATPDKLSLVERCLARLPAERLSRPGRPLRDLLDTLVELAGTEGFAVYLHATLNEALAEGMDIAWWQTLLNVLLGQYVQLPLSAGEMRTLFVGFQKARILLSEMLRFEQGRGWTELQRHLLSLRVTMERLTSVASVDELMSDLTDELERLDIKTCVVAGYSPEIRHLRGEEWTLPGHASIMLAYRDGKRLTLSREGSSFSPGEHLLPPAFLQPGRACVLVATSLYFREDQIGYIVFEPGQRDQAIYETFCVQLGNILRGSLLFMARQKAEERLKQVLAELEEYNQKLSGLSQTDELTELYNRRGFLGIGAQNLALARRMGRAGNVFFADLDGLKKINDTYGHREGDAAIRTAADALRQTFRGMDTIGRLGGDEFAILAINTKPDFVVTLRRRLASCLDAWNSRSGKPYLLAMSIGAVPFDADSSCVLDDLLSRADEVLYVEKQRKKGLGATST